ncbi:hypothetical protein UA08_05085 [Talaromyces atroroseus]|uniref:Uncharacterized protein n=1 Tax=Talaromyces atroroseus TaxID=1441469 RepID=A0A225AWR1_TALAT|nr:hypothetical protein UA08_05085 [Talaromyces atroroseus]OKL59406.1 hypothetical protein UA08_05085 [Talaromyces atroroseus]
MESSTVTIKSSPMPATTKTTRNGSGNPPAGLGVLQRQRSTTVGSSIPVSSADNAGRKKSLLPQRRTVADLKKAQGRALPEPPRADPQDVKEAPSPPRVVTRSKSPVKPQQNDSKSTASVATKKTAMPPPARPTRSASLRQQSTPKLVGSADGKGHTRHRSQILSTARTTTGTGTPPLLPTASRQPEKPGVAKQPRPQFTTYQQHYSLKKEKEAPRTTERRVGKPTESNVTTAAAAARPEIAALQTELLQLCLLYSSSLQQDKEWKSAAENQLKEKHHSVAAAYRALSDEERYIQERLNFKALYDWSVDSATVAEIDDGNNFQAQIQSFSRVTQEVAGMTTDATGRYTSAIQAFEEWLAEVESVRESRDNLSTSATNLEEEDPRYIDTLGRVWRDEVDDLSIKAELCLRELAKMTIFAINEDDFCRKHSSSALVKIAQQQREILRLMVDELKAMRTIELETVSLEKSWLAQAADQVTADYRLGKNSSACSVGAWKAI